MDSEQRKRSDTLEFRRHMARQRALLNAVVREYFLKMDFEEVETPCMVPAPGQEPSINAFECPFVPETPEGRACTLYLHTSPEYAMKRLLAEGFQRIFQLARVFRNGEVAPHHNPEFTMLEFYRAHADYNDIMADTEGLVKAAAEAFGLGGAIRLGKDFVSLEGPFERLTVRDAFLTRTGLDIEELKDGGAFKAAAKSKGYLLPGSCERFDDVFYQLFLTEIEPTLGRERPTFLIDYPASMASLSRLKPSDPSVAERVELYVAGIELANGFSELNDEAEQRSRFAQEREERRQNGLKVYPLDEKFLSAVGRMPPASGIAVGFDRLLMLLTGTENIADLFLFPAKDFFDR